MRGKAVLVDDLAPFAVGAPPTCAVDSDPRLSKREQAETLVTNKLGGVQPLVQSSGSPVLNAQLAQDLCIVTSRPHFLFRQV